MNKQETAQRLKEFRQAHNISLYLVSQRTGLAINQIKAVELDLKCNADSFMKLVQFYTQSALFPYSESVKLILDLFSGLQPEATNAAKAVKHTTWSDAIKAKMD